ncbi:MAG: Dolichyl-phosphate-mannose-protein mannosyltransferase [Verrucomicrobiota bacterium]
MAGRSTVLFGRDGKVWFAILLAALGFLTASLFHTINVPWVEEDNVFGAAYAQAACNNLRAGFSVTAGVPATFYLEPLPIPPSAYYVHHPVLFPLLITASVGMLGEKEWAIKLVPIGCSILSVWLLWLLVGDAINKRAAAFAVAFFATLPMELHYGDLVDYEPCLVMWMLAALVCLRNREVRPRRRWTILATVCCVCALWTDWPGYLFTVSVVVSLLLKKEKASRRFAILLLGMAVLSGLLFLLQIRYVNPEAWRDLWTAVTMRLGSGMQPGSSGIPPGPAPHFTFGEWLRRIFQSLGQDYLVADWLFVGVGAIYLARNMKQPGFRWLGGAVLQMAIPGVLYMVLLRNWSFIHDFASFFCIGSIAILGGLGLEFVWAWLERRPRENILRPAGAVATLGFLVWLAVAGFARAEDQRSQFLILDGIADEPSNLIPDLGRYLAKTFPADATILCNFDPYYSSLSYYAKRTIYTNLRTSTEWNAVAADQGGSAVGGILWLGAPSAADILASLPTGEIIPVEIDGVRFAAWMPVN